MEASPENYYIDPLNDCVITVGFVVTFALVRYYLDVSLFASLASWVLSPANLRRKNQKFSKQSFKFRTTCWKFVSYVFLSSIAIYLLKDQAFIYDTILLWRGWPREVFFPEPLRIFYLCELGFYIYSTLILPFEPIQNDKLAMYAHHLATITLIVLSYLLGFWKIGLLLMVLHDVSDPILEFSRLVFSMGEHGEQMAQYPFALFAFVFILTRCYYLPFVIIRSVWFEAMDNIRPELSNLPYYPTYYGLLFFLLVLQTLHVYWTFLILKMINKGVRNGRVPKDEREPDEDDD
eukprot:TRINITY_DN5099_c0_g1_i1.p1 TRINITY_DN5099_c0_g1~~TRINITY_DN5099_c0_g1_i1.p1  ORF type:complete len:291 (-),score=46.40 TRINITY_DN5099_c0_g1_i1:240-1112(-)